MKKLAAFRDRPVFGPLTPQQLALTGEYMIQEAILYLLYEREEGFRVGALAEILGLRHKGNWTIQQTLQRLRDQGKVYQPRGSYTEWTLTASERERRD